MQRHYEEMKKKAVEDANDIAREQLKELKDINEVTVPQIMQDILSRSVLGFQYDG